jgi:hypothetical protein
MKLHQMSANPSRTSAEKIFTVKAIAAALWKPHSAAQSFSRSCLDERPPRD